MSDLVVIVPTRGRPEAVRELAEAFASTCTADTRLVFAVDGDDPRLSDYDREFEALPAAFPASLAIGSEPTTMVGALNSAALTWAHLATDEPFAIGFMGDDHRPRSAGWDQAYVDALRDLGVGIVYGDDLLQRENLPTQCAMTSDIVRALGYMCPPRLRHMYVDNFWLDLGRAAGCIRYLPDVVVEHMHPIAGKAEWTEGHARVNDPKVFAYDRTVFWGWRTWRLPADTAKVQQLILADSQANPREWRMFDDGTVPEHTTADWYAERDRAPHLEQDVHRARLTRSAELVALALEKPGCGSVVDLGAGDGGLLSLLGPDAKAWGYDLQPTNLAGAGERGVDVRLGDVVGGDLEWGDVAVATEMLEHLVDPHAFVRRIAAHAQVLVCSSPWIERPGAAYEFHTWCWNLAGYRALIEQAGFNVVVQDVVGPFQVLLAVKP